MTPLRHDIGRGWEAVFRNNLMPGQYPYPFWHDPKKWDGYERANGLTLWIDPYTSKIVVGVGLFRADNPYLEQLQTTYKDLALAMRKGTCNRCHVPDNPEKMKRLVLLQTPVVRGTRARREKGEGQEAGEESSHPSSRRDRHLGPPSSHSFSDLSGSRNNVLARAGGRFRSSRVADAMLPATRERKDSILISSPWNRPTCTSIPLTSQNREPIRNRCAMNTRRPCRQR